MRKINPPFVLDKKTIKKETYYEIVLYNIDEAWRAIYALNDCTEENESSKCIIKHNGEKITSGSITEIIMFLKGVEFTINNK
jgi:hypothetical protein